jgi:hypothetical protein
MFVRTLEKGDSLDYFLCLENSCAHLKTLQLQFEAYKRHNMNLELSPIDCISLFTFMGLSLVM